MHWIGWQNLSHSYLVLVFLVGQLWCQRCRLGAEVQPLNPRHLLGLRELLQLLLEAGDVVDVVLLGLLLLVDGVEAGLEQTSRERLLELQ